MAGIFDYFQGFDQPNPYDMGYSQTTPGSERQQPRGLLSMLGADSVMDPAQQKAALAIAAIQAGGRMLQASAPGQQFRPGFGAVMGHGLAGAADSLQGQIGHAQQLGMLRDKAAAARQEHALKMYEFQQKQQDKANAEAGNQAFWAAAASRTGLNIPPEQAKYIPASVGQQALNTNMDNAIALQRLSLDAQKAAQEAQTAGKYVMMTDQGAMVIDARSGAAQPATAPGGGAVGKPLKDAPDQVVKAVTENAKAISNIDAAIAEIESNPSALGAKNLLPDAATQRLDPKGVPARGALARVAGQKYHDLSGAVVTASEAHRLRPYIPSASDTPEAALTKLRALRAEYTAVNGMFSQQYAPERGFKQSPIFNAQPPLKKGDRVSPSSGRPSISDFWSK